MEADRGPRLRDALARSALAEIPKLLTLLDRTPHSATYGCFDRSYWQYRIADFPCGMSQEFVWPLALVLTLDLPQNPYRGVPALREWIEAGIRYTARSSHPDGSCDDYYPFERAAGAAAFSLLGMLEATRRIGLAPDAELEDFFRRRAHWLACHEESGRLSNHEALIVSALAHMSAMFGPDPWERHLARRLERLRSWQSDEGWFQEYAGADPGYLSLTIGLLADLDRRRPDLQVRAACGRAIAFFASCVHPDGTAGGEYASRTTLNFFPHGFEIAAAWMPEATAINDLALRPLAESRAPCFADDRIVGHHLWSRLLAWEAFRPDRGTVAVPAPPARRWFPAAGLLVDRRGGGTLFAGLRKGGAFKIFDGDRLALSDTGPSVRVGGRVAVATIDGGPPGDPTADGFAIEGRMAWARQARLSPAKNVVLRMAMLTVGRFFPNLMRRALQRLLVTGRHEAPFAFRREVSWAGNGWRVIDTVTPLPAQSGGWRAVGQVGIGGFQTASTTVMARVFQPEQFQPWLDLGGRLESLASHEPLRVERFVAVGGGA